MSKIVPVSLLKAGDKFAFVNGPSSGSSSPLNQESKTILVVTRPPAVNLAANTCFFRYQQAATLDTGPNSRESNDSWNGAPDTQVRLVTGETPGAPPAADVPAAAAANNKPVVKSTASVPRSVEKSAVEIPATPKAEAESDAVPQAKSVKTRILRTAKPKEAKPQDEIAAAKPAAGKSSSGPRTAVAKRVAVETRAAVAPISERAATEKSAPAKSEPRQGIAIFPSLTKAAPSKSTTKKLTIDPPAAQKVPAKKSAAAKASPKKKAVKKTVRKK